MKNGKTSAEFNRLRQNARPLLAPSGGCLTLMNRDKPRMKLPQARPLNSRFLQLPNLVKRLGRQSLKSFSSFGWSLLEHVIRAP